VSRKVGTQSTISLKQLGLVEWNERDGRFGVAKLIQRPFGESRLQGGAAYAQTAPAAQELRTFCATPEALRALGKKLALAWRLQSALAG
jgi:hypothetical protein